MKESRSGVWLGFSPAAAARLLKTDPPLCISDSSRLSSARAAKQRDTIRGSAASPDDKRRELKRCGGKACDVKRCGVKRCGCTSCGQQRLADNGPGLARVIVPGAEDLGVARGQAGNVAEAHTAVLIS